VTETGPEFAAYWKKVRARTMRLLELVPEEDLEWTPVPGKFTFGDLFRHLAGIERLMYGENARGLPSRYAGHGADLAAGKDAVRAYAGRCHAETCEILEALTADDLAATTPEKLRYRVVAAGVVRHGLITADRSLMLGLRGLSSRRSTGSRRKSRGAGRQVGPESAARRGRPGLRGLPRPIASRQTPARGSFAKDPGRGGIRGGRACTPASDPSRRRFRDGGLPLGRSAWEIQ
jgi:hypothetical protein